MAHFLRFNICCLFLISSTNSLPLTPLLDSVDILSLQTTCNTKSGGCGGQSDKAKRNRAAVKESLTRDLGDGHFRGMSPDQAESLLQGTQSIKNTLLAINQLVGIVASDNGLFSGDRVIKSQSEIFTLTGRLKNALPSLDVDLSNPTNIIPKVGDLLGRRKRSDSLSLDYYRGNRWPTNTINVFIDSKIFSKNEAKYIRDALQSISSQVPCIKFQETTNDPKIEYVKAPKGTDSGTCGWSSIGYQKGQRNDINLNFGSSTCLNTMKGVAIHETLHALGFAHEHTRNDRDNFIKIDWKNIDPQSIDIFNKDDPNDFNPYGQSYDELSIMHYDVYVGASDEDKPAFTSIKHPELASQIGNGQSMTDKDTKLLKRLYCGSFNCRDAGPNCGWRALNNECSKIQTACPKSCGTCDNTSG